jgi:hypothetical protein
MKPYKRPEPFLSNTSAKQIPTVIAVFFIADIALLFFYVANQAVGEPFYSLNGWLDLNSEASLATWYSVIQLACVAALAGLFAARNFHATHDSTWLLLILPLIFLALSIDELVQIHEWLGEKSDALLPGDSRENTLFKETGIWMFLLGIPFIVGFLGIIFILRKYLTTVPGVLPKLLVGLTIFITGAVLIESLSNFTQTGFWYHVELVFEEGCELLGITIILWAFYDLLLGHNLQIHLDPVDVHQS